MILARVKAAIMLLGNAAYDLVASSIDVARIVLSRTERSHPAILAYPVELKTRWGAGLLASLISLTPGSVCLHIAEDLSALYIHVLDGRSESDIVERFKRLYERRILELEG